MSFPSTINLSTLVADGYGYVLRGGAGSYSGFSVSGAGDINGDGLDDLIIGARGGDPAFDDEGAAYVIFGQTGTTRTEISLTSGTLAATDGFIIRGANPLDSLGYGVADAGDVNGDGIDDLIVGANLVDAGGSQAGGAYVIYGQTGATRPDLDVGSLAAADGFFIQGDTDRDQAGNSVSGVGDINGDGIADVIVGVRDNDASGIDSGAAYVIYGQSGSTRGVVDLTGLAASDGFIIQGETAGSLLGRSVSGLGDVNGDGFADLMVGADYSDAAGNNAGAAYVIYGTGTATRDPVDVSAMPASTGFVILGAAANDLLGISVADLGDVNGDGIADMIVGAIGSALDGDVSGAAYVVYGQVGTTRTVIDLAALTASDGFAIQGDAAADNAGFSTAGAGDINGDGIQDIIVGARRGDNAGDNAGEAYVIFGKTGSTRGTIDLSSLSASDGFVIEGENSGDQAGFSIAAAGDVNGDGLDDLIVGAPIQDNVGTVAGAAYVIYGRSSIPTAGDDDLTGTSGPDLIDLGAGNDTYSGNAGDDTIIGGPGVDSLSGDGDDDTFRFADGDLATGEVIDGGDGTDTLVFLGGTHDLSGATITGIEAIELDDAAGTEITVDDLAQAKLISGANGAADVLNIADATPGAGEVQVEVFFSLLTLGIDTINWTGPAGNFSATLLDADTMAITDPRGQSHTVDFTAGQRVSQTTTDTLDSYDFQTITRTFDATGAQTGETRVLDDGTEIVTTLADGLPTQQTISDLDDVADFTSKTLRFNELGILVQFDRSDDDGLLYQVNYDSAGLRVDETSSDLSADGTAYSWDSIYRQFDSLGQVTYIARDEDSGVRTMKYFTDGVLVQMSQVDASAGGLVHGWTQIDQYFDAATGVLTQIDRVDDNGKLTQNYFTDGIRTSQSQFDNSEGGLGFDWSRIDNFYDATGALIRTYRTDDSGLDTETLFENGLRTQSTRSDMADDFDWTFITTTFNADGSVRFTNRQDDTGRNSLIGTAGDDSLVGSTTIDQALVGDTGADTFVFLAGFTIKTIADYGNGADLIDLTDVGIGFIDDLIAEATAITQEGDDLAIDLDAIGRLILRDFAIGDIDQIQLVPLALL